MTSSELEKNRQILETRVMELSQSAQRRDGICIEQHADALDSLVHAAERELAIQNLENRASRLQEAQAALQRIANGSYGICVECEEPIRPARLNAVPWAALCISCQQRADYNQGTVSQPPELEQAA